MLAPAQLGFTGSLAMALRHRWDPEALFVILTAYLDESGTHQGSPIMVMGGWVATADCWNEIDLAWNSILARDGLSHIHATKLVNGNGEFRGWSEDRRLALIDELTEIVYPAALFGACTALNRDDFRHHYIAGSRPRKIQLDTEYGLSFRLILNFVIQTIERQGFNEKVELYVVLEAGHKNAGDALRLFDVFKKHAPPEWREMVKSVTFARKKDSPGLQAADFLAYPAWRLEATKQVEVRPDDIEQITDLVDRDWACFRLPIDTAVLREAKQNILTAVEARYEFGRQRPLAPLSGAAIASEKASEKSPS